MSNVSIQPLFDHRVVTGPDALSVLHADILSGARRRWAVLCDENTANCCLPLLKSRVPALQEVALIVVPAGEEHKSLDQAVRVWRELTRLNLGRKDGLLNLGGGMITDLGGFVAANYLRGIPFVNVPTSLLAQVDAAIGGKTGVDLDFVKNRIGLFSFPMAVYSWPGFFNTLPFAEWESACAEVVKHALIANEVLWSELLVEGLTVDAITTRLARIQQVKLEVVAEDPQETDRRKILNFGHTMGHALESESLLREMPMSHGYAVAWGMIMELNVAAGMGWMSDLEVAEITGQLNSMFQLPVINDFNPDALMRWVQLDKKNELGGIRMSLLKTIGHCDWNVEVPADIVRAVFTKYCKG